MGNPVYLFSCGSLLVWLSKVSTKQNCSVSSSLAVCLYILYRVIQKEWDFGDEFMNTEFSFEPCWFPVLVHQFLTYLPSNNVFLYFPLVTCFYIFLRSLVLIFSGHVFLYFPWSRVFIFSFGHMFLYFPLVTCFYICPWSNVFYIFPIVQFSPGLL